MSIGRSVVLMCVCAGLGLGCEAEPQAVDDAERAQAELGQGAVAPSTPTPLPAGSSQLVLDQRPDGARIVGRLEPVPPNADPDRVLVIRVRGVAPAIAEQLDGARVCDARFVGDAIVTIGADHVLRAHTADGVDALDTRAYEPMSVAGAAVAYVRGEPPFLELARANVATGAVTALTDGMAPAWSPAFTPDGESIVFVSGAEGSPRLYRIEGSGAPEALPRTERTPASPIAPRFEDGLLVFEDERGRAWLDLDRGAIVRTEAR